MAFIGHCVGLVTKGPAPLSRSLHTTASSELPSLTIRHFAPKTKRVKQVRSNVAPPGTPSPQRIAVVGGGLAGLAVTYHLLNSTARYARKRDYDHTSMHITIFDPAYPGTAGASAAAAGLLHEFRPRPKRKLWNHQKGIDAALHLLGIAEANGQKLVSNTGILKLAFDERTEEDFKIAAYRFSNEVEFISASDIEHRFPTVRARASGLFIKKAHVVDTIAYMKSLWDICMRSGRVTWQQREISAVSDLFNENTGIHADGNSGGPYDNVVLCAGAAVKQFTDLENVPLTPCLGQNLILESENLSVDVPLMSGSYVVPKTVTDQMVSDETEQNISIRPVRQIVAGATYEYGLNAYDDGVDIEDLKAVLSKRLHKLVPQLYDDWKVMGAQSGVRALPPRLKEGAIPIAVKVEGTPSNRWCWVLTGLGGRGLIYHAFLGRKLAHAIAAGNDTHIPGDARKQVITLKASEAVCS